MGSLTFSVLVMVMVEPLLDKEVHLQRRLGLAKLPLMPAFQPQPTPQYRFVLPLLVLVHPYGLTGWDPL